MGTSFPPLAKKLFCFSYFRCFFSFSPFYFFISLNYFLLLQSYIKPLTICDLVGIKQNEEEACFVFFQK